MRLVRAASVPFPRCRLARLRRHRTHETGRAALWLDPRRYAGDGGRAALLSPRRADPALRLAVGPHAPGPLRDDAAVHRCKSRACPLYLAQALPGKPGEVIQFLHPSRDRARSARGGEVALAAFLPPRRLQGTTGTRAEWFGSVSLKP